jgi:AAA15 family ATPase/GTPase
MLISFSVENYKSIREKITLDLECASGKELPETTMTYRDNRYNKLAAIYGPNASGKSNLIDAISMMKTFVEASISIAPTTVFTYLPFAFDPHCAQKPTSFDLLFTKGGILYDYSFSYNHTSVVKEELSYSPNGRTTLIYSRNEKGEYRYGSSGEGTKLRELEAKTGPNKLFLATLCAFNYEKVLPVYDFLANDLYLIHENQAYSTKPGSSIESVCYDCLANDEKYRNFVISFLKNADFNISDIKAKKLQRRKTIFSVGPNNLPTVLPTDGVEVYTDVHLTHQVSTGGFDLPMNLESEGTLAMLALSHLFYEALTEDKVIIADGLDDEMHPSMLAYFLTLFPKMSAKTESQLIFALHNTSVMSKEYLRRDQIYLIDKKDDGSTDLFSLADFSVRKDAHYERDYLLGRFGAVPLVKKVLN